MIDRNHLVVGLFLVLLAAATGSYIVWGGRNAHPPYDPSVMNASSTTATTTDASPSDVPAASDHAYGNVVLKLNETASFPDGLSITPTTVLEDSRCPTGVMCIQAGTVRVSVHMRTTNGTSDRAFKLGTSVTTATQTITLVSVDPVKRAGQTIGQGDYSFTFKVAKAQAASTTATTPTQTPTSTQCYVGGCSAQLCTDNPHMASTCEYTAQYACYKTAKCERQSSGQCGWTQTPALASCLANPPQSQQPTSSSTSPAQ